MSVGSGGFKSTDRNAITGRSYEPNVSRTDTNSADTYRYKKTTHSAILTKTNIPAKDGIVTIAQGPPVGTYNLPTTFDENASDHKASAAFLSSGRSSSLLEHSTMYYRSIRDDIQRTNVGPGSYNLAYSWRTDDNNNHHFPSSSTETGSVSPIRGSPKSTNPGEYDRPWLLEKTVPAPTAEELQFIKNCDADDVEAVKSLPSY